MQHTVFVDSYAQPKGPQQTEVPPLIYWAQQIQTVEVEKRINEIFKMYKGGYTQVQYLMAYVDLVSFVLKHGDP